MKSIFDNLSEEEREVLKKTEQFYKDFHPERKGMQTSIVDYEPPVPVTPKVRKTYSQVWSAYNAAQMREKIFLLHILNELLDNIPFPPKHGRGRNPLPMKDKLFFIVLQAYNAKSSRRCIADLEICKMLGFTTRTPHFNTILKCLKDSSVERYLKHLIHVSGLPLQQVEQDFAVDSSGFSTSQFDRWFDVRLGEESDKRRFRKAHVMCGIQTQIITSINITKGTAGDSPEFDFLVHKTKELFPLHEVSADMAYLSRDNLQTVSDLGGVAYIPFKKNSQGRPKGHTWLWRTMFDYFHTNQEEFMEHYHKRSKVETCFHMIKRKFDAYVRSKNEIGQNNEILTKCLAHNICVLIQESFELGIDINFKKCAEIPIAHK